MGLGDALLATGQARTLHEQTGRRVCIVRSAGPYWSEVFDHNPRLARLPGPGVQTLRNGSGCRPYIHAKGHRWTWRTWDIRPGELYLTAEEKAFAEPFRGLVLIEPNTKVPGGNKSWLPERWQAVVDQSGLAFVQVGGGPVRLRGVTQAVTTFRQAAAVLSVCRAYVGPEGALHHAAAALDVPAVVLWSEFISPEYTGYAQHRNIRYAGPACGARAPCQGCRQSMERIEVDEVVENLEIACSPSPA